MKTHIRNAVVLVNFTQRTCARVNKLIIIHGLLTVTLGGDMREKSHTLINLSPLNLERQTYLNFGEN